MEQSVRLVNNGDQDFVYPYDGRMVTIPAGGELFVPFNAMVAWMGHPNLRNTDYDRWREESYNNLCLFYGALTTQGANPEKLPKLAAYDTEGNRITTILDDPSGATLVVDTSNTSEHSDMAILAQQVRTLTSALSAAGIEVGADGSITTAAGQAARATVEQELAPDPTPGDIERPAGPITDEMPPADVPTIIKVGGK